MAVGKVDRHADEAVEAVGHHFGPRIAQQCVDTADVHEADGHMTVLGVVIVAEQPTSHGTRDEHAQKFGVVVGFVARRVEPSTAIR